MGCDIHGVVEIFHQGEWKMAMDIKGLSPRNYLLFSLFDVRGRAGHELGRRAFPANISWHSKYCFCDSCGGKGSPEASKAKDVAEWVQKYGSDEDKADGYCGGCADWHSTSYITMQEIEKHWAEIDAAIANIDYQQGWRVVFDTMRFWSEYLKEKSAVVESVPAIATGTEDASTVRLIVWFDN